MRDPEMDVARARTLVATALADELGVDPEALLGRS